MAQGVKATPSELRTASGKIKNHGEQYAASIKTMYSSADAIRNSGWQDAGADKFNEAMGSFKPTFKSMEDFIANVSIYLAQTADQYDATQNAVTGLWGSITK